MIHALLLTILDDFMANKCIAHKLQKSNVRIKRQKSSNTLIILIILALYQIAVHDIKFLRKQYFHAGIVCIL